MAPITDLRIAVEASEVYKRRSTEFSDGDGDSVAHTKALREAMMDIVAGKILEEEGYGVAHRALASSRLLALYGEQMRSNRRADRNGQPQQSPAACAQADQVELESLAGDLYQQHRRTKELATAEGDEFQGRVTYAMRKAARDFVARYLEFAQPNTDPMVALNHCRRLPEYFELLATSAEANPTLDERDTQYWVRKTMRDAKEGDLLDRVIAEEASKKGRKVPPLFGGVSRSTDTP